MAPDWEVVSAVGALATPLVVLVLGFVLTRRQSRSQELLKARLDYYQSLMPMLNDLMCFMTFIGSWRDLPPPRVVQLKRELDREFHCAHPLFSDPVKPAYDTFMDLCFKTFNEWGSDPRIVSSAYQRRRSWQQPDGWEPSWNDLFLYADDRPIPGAELKSIREAYDALVRAMVIDLNMARARSQYTSAQVSLNAHAPARDDIAGSEEEVGSPHLGANPFHDMSPADESQRP